jgi:hypothetical protein
MRQAAAALAVLMLGACTDLPDRVGTLGACAEISQSDYEGHRSRHAAWRTVDLTGGGFGSEAAGQSRQRCWPRVQGMNSSERRCVQQNDLVVEMRTDAATKYYHVPAHTTYMVYGEAGQARCSIVMQEE